MCAVLDFLPKSMQGLQVSAGFALICPYGLLKSAFAADLQSLILSFATEGKVDFQHALAGPELSFVNEGKARLIKFACHR